MIPLWSHATTASTFIMYNTANVTALGDQATADPATWTPPEADLRPTVRLTSTDTEETLS